MMVKVIALSCSNPPDWEVLSVRHALQVYSELEKLAGERDCRTIILETNNLPPPSPPLFVE